jgi:hypothetical protein
MGEYADDYYRQDVMKRYGFDPGSMYSNNTLKKNTCPKCGKHMGDREKLDYLTSIASKLTFK